MTREWTNSNRQYMNVRAAETFVSAAFAFIRHAPCFNDFELLKIRIMKNHYERIARRAAKSIRHWWLLLIAGMLSIVAGILVFVFPLESYVLISIIFGIVVLLTGVVKLTVAATSENYLAMKGYVIVSGVLDVLLGIFLCVWPGVTLLLLPIMMGIWLMYNSFIIIAFGGDMQNFKIEGSGWTIAFGIILLIISILVLLNPLAIGINTVVVLAGIGLVFFGMIMTLGSVKLRDLERLIDVE